MDAKQLISILQEAVMREESGGLDPHGAITPYGLRSEMTWTKFKEMREAGQFQEVRVKETSLTLPSATMYGCTGIFGLCGPDEIIGLTMKDDPLVAWLGFLPDYICEKFVKGWTYVDVAGTAAGSITTHVYGAPCDDPPEAEYGVCEFFQGDFGTLRACGQSVDVSSIGLRKCDKQPTYTIPVEGVGPIRIDNDLDLETINGAQVVKHELSREVITGDKSVAYQFDGLEQIVRTGYASIDGELCTAMDSIVVDWQNDDLSGAVNGHGSIITKIRDVFRRIAWRVAQTGLGALAEGDVVLVMPHWLAWEVLDEWAVWSFVEQVGGNQVVFRDAYDLRAVREKYARGLYGAGYVTIDGFNLHIIAHDWMTISQDAPNFCADIYMLTRRIGGKTVLNGQYMPVDQGAMAANAEAGFGYFQSESMQGGRAMRWMKFDNACIKPCLLIRPRLYCETPWAQARISNVCVAVQFTPQSLDPQSNYFIEDNLVAVNSYTQYWYEEGSGWFH